MGYSRLKRILLATLLSGFSLSVSAKTLNLPANYDDKLPNNLIEAALKRGGIYDFQYPDENITVTMSRQLNNTTSGEYHMMWTLTSRELEERLIPVRIPIYKGMLGMRVGIVRKDRANLFANVRSLDDLRQFSAGQGTLWADTAILEANQIPVVKEMKYPNLFPMLEGGRFDYFPRGIHEPWSEIERESKYNLTVEPTLIMRYVAPFYFFVSPQYPEVATHLEKVLKEMIADGSFDEFFLNDREVKSALAQGNVAQRKVYELINPTLHPDTPLDVKEYWFDPLTYKP